MKTYKTLALILVLVILTGIATWFHLSSREEVAEGTTQLTIDNHKQTVKLDALNYEPVSGVRVNGKGETIPVEGEGISVKALLESQNVDAYSKVTVVSDDSYTAGLTAEEVAEERRIFCSMELMIRSVVNSAQWQCPLPFLTSTSFSMAAHRPRPATAKSAFAARMRM